MKTPLLAVLPFFAISVCLAGETNVSITEIQTHGLFGFPQEKANVLYDWTELRFSVWNNDKYLFAQAILWNDSDDSTGKNAKDTELCDWSDLILDLDANLEPTAHVDRNYILDPYPSMRGLYYTVDLGNFSTTGLTDDSQGRGAVRHVQTSNGRNVRVDTYLIPLSEISRKPGDKIRICYWGFSPKPAMTVNSAGYTSASGDYYSYEIPHSRHRDYVLMGAEKVDVDKIPDDRKRAAEKK